MLAGGAEIEAVRALGGLYEAARMEALRLLGDGTKRIHPKPYEGALRAFGGIWGTVLHSRVQAVVRLRVTA